MREVPLKLNGRRTVTRDVAQHAPSSSLLLSSLEQSDTDVYAPCIRALLGTASQFCETVVLKSRNVPNSTIPRSNDGHFWCRQSGHSIQASNRIAQVLDSYRRSPEFGDVWFKSRQLKKTIWTFMVYAKWASRVWASIPPGVTMYSPIACTSPV